jgi:hypothetical protein
MTLQQIINEIEHLSSGERVILITRLAESLADEHKPHDWTEFEGMAAHLADGIDAQEYVNQLRSEWGHRP